MEVVCDEELLNMEKLFSYGTLQYEAVQLDTFGRKLDGKKDKLFKHKIERVKYYLKYHMMNCYLLINMKLMNIPEKKSYLSQEVMDGCMQGHKIGVILIY